jgi:hypothetical protein
VDRDFSDMLNALLAEKVEHLIVGAYALARHGLVRATGDIDIWVRPTQENAERVWRALKRFNAPLSRLNVSDLLDTEMVYQIGLPPHRIDIMTSIAGVEFVPAWEKRVTMSVDGVELNLLCRDDLITNKRAAGRPKDIADAIWLESERDRETQP